MTVAAVPVARPGRRLGVALRRIQWHHPEWWAAAAAAVGWLVLGAHAVRDLTGVPAAHHDGLGPGSGHGGPVDVALCSIVMAVTMMVPLTLPALRHAALSSRWRRRHRAAAGFLAGYLAVWIPAGAVLVVAGDALVSVLGGSVTVAVAFALATLWQRAPAKRRLLSRCRRTRPLAPLGWRADRDCARLGVGVGWSCAATCWALMAATVAAGHSVAVMAVLFGVQLHERFGRRFASGLTALVVAALGAAVMGARALGHT